MNAKEEFLEHIEDRKVLCAYIKKSSEIDQLMEIDEYLFNNGDRPNLGSILHKGYSQEDFDEFLKSIDFEYYNGYGGQELFGTIWYEDGTWSSRGEYDGSEWWRHFEVPEILEELLTKNGNNS
jgi:hypothetical protein